MRRQRNEQPSAVSLGREWERVAAFASAFDGALDRWLGDTHRLGLTEYRALDLLSQAPDRELRVNELAQRLGLNPSSVTRLVTRLEGKRLARRDVCADDGRGVYAVLDQPGERLLQEVRPQYEARVVDQLARLEAHLPQSDASAVAAALTAVAGRVQR